MQLEKKTCRRFGKRLRELRRRNRWTLEEFAELAGIDSSYLGKIERGDRNPSLGVIARIAIALEMSLSDLFDGISLA